MRGGEGVEVDKDETVAFNFLVYLCNLLTFKSCRAGMWSNVYFVFISNTCVFPTIFHRCDNIINIPWWLRIVVVEVESREMFYKWLRLFSVCCQHNRGFMAITGIVAKRNTTDVSSRTGTASSSRAPGYCEVCVAQCLAFYIQFCISFFDLQLLSYFQTFVSFIDVHSHSYRLDLLADYACQPT